MASSRKIINDPIYGFINIDDELIFQLIEHPYFQRLRRIRQLGLTGLVYPGATHTRFHHAIGAMHLMHRAIAVLRNKGVEITEDEALSAKAAILLHDIGHGPFSHVLEDTILIGVHHEQLSLAYMHRLNGEFNGALEQAIQIFSDTYPKRFLHQLVSSQLDMDRLDYLTRDSFYTGVSEGIVGLERIIHMLNVREDQLVIDEKGVYSVEKFIVARRLMYWQVYLHKTALAADGLLLSIMRRARYLVDGGKEVFMLPKLAYFLKNRIQAHELSSDPTILDRFNELDDIELYACIKYWKDDVDPVLAYLCNSLINRKLPATRFQETPFSDEQKDAEIKQLSGRFNWTEEDCSFLVYSGLAANEAYDSNSEKILINRKNGELMDLVHASDNYNFSSPNRVVRKYFLCTPK
ncbi:MAG: HD domain-containing protein [Flavobacteriales bacterium]|nr:HD domain-containing protein [Bacteroidota bacterium]MCB9239704.1 HD domain-containing protein [Flavobacteriales bacterium]